ncbi:MAG: pantoate--beta-alanine ligase [Deltaproteobacteria bacterium]|nr:pantoate--beta-alanine ligase [Deltaproteobacteria bacterium]
MLQISHPQEIQQIALHGRRAGQRIALVPTMGYLHEGHLSLMRAARQRADLVIVSIFVNPIQFGPHEDLERYPRDLASDLAKCHSVEVDFVFTPHNTELYPDAFQTSVAVNQLSQGLCGAGRPGHFQGVTTVVAKLFNLTLPDFAFFGEKDFQQLAVIRRMVMDLNFPITIVGVPIVREADGLAMSSRNAYLAPALRREAPLIYQALTHARQLYRQGRRYSDELLSAVRRELEENLRCAFAIEYIKLCSVDNLNEINGRITGPAVLLIAIRFGETRLIDNLQLNN